MCAINTLTRIKTGTSLTPAEDGTKINANVDSKKTKKYVSSA